MVNQKDLIKSYFVQRPNQDIETEDVVDWAVREWRKKTGKVFRDPDRAVRGLYSDGFLQKIEKGVYRYDPDHVTLSSLEGFSPNQKEEIKKRDGYKCAVCGKRAEEGVEIHVDHIKPKDKGGRATLENGQVLCGEHNYKKKNYNQTETAKTLFVNLHREARSRGDSKLEKFAIAILKTYEEHGVNGHIEWEED